MQLKRCIDYGRLLRMAAIGSSSVFGEAKRWLSAAAAAAAALITEAPEMNRDTI